MLSYVIPKFTLVTLTIPLKSTYKFCNNLDDQLRYASTRLQKYQDGIAFGMDFTQKMRKGYFLTFSSMLNAEDTLLSLDIDDDGDGIFVLYCSCNC